MVKALDLRGQVFDRLTALHRGESNSRGQARWWCTCSCGGKALVTASDLRSGNTRSCGCLQSEKRDQTTHGGTGTRLYDIWCGIKKRCYNPKSTIWDYYGGKGIRVCEEWQSFEPFRDWATKNGYSDHLQIDREDPDGHYEPANCSWVTKAVNIARRNAHHRRIG